MSWCHKNIQIAIHNAVQLRKKAEKELGEDERENVIINETKILGVLLRQKGEDRLKNSNTNERKRSGSQYVMRAACKN